MVRFNRSMNDVFTVEESSERVSASSNRQPAPMTARRSTRTTRSWRRVRLERLLDAEGAIKAREVLPRSLGILPQIVRENTRACASDLRS